MKNTATLSRPESVRPGQSIVTVDQGNTAIKLTVWTIKPDGALGPVSYRTYDSSESDVLYADIESIEACGGIYCSVGRMDVRLVESLRCILDGCLIVLTQATPLPVGVRYATPATLGMDRVAVAVGAYALYPGERCLIVDAGTAITADLLTGEGDFAGGRISPGLALRFRSLHDYTSRLPLLHPEAEVPETGVDTASSIRVGVMRGAAAEIAEAATTCEVARVLLTGGDAAVLLPTTTEVARRLGAPEPEYIPHLLGLGLAEIFLYNVYNLNDDNV